MAPRFSCCLMLGQPLLRDLPQIIIWQIKVCVCRVGGRYGKRENRQRGLVSGLGFSEQALLVTGFVPVLGWPL